MLSKSTGLEGSGPKSYKSNIFPSTYEVWIYIKYKLNIYEPTIIINKYHTKYRTKRIRHSLQYVSVQNEREWEQVRLNTFNQLSNLKI